MGDILGVETQRSTCQIADAQNDEIQHMRAMLDVTDAM